MKTFETVSTQKLKSITCDKCKTTIDGQEIQECFSWKNTYGYFSDHFGDMTSVEIDLCEACTFDLLGQYMRKEKTQW